DVEVTRRVDAHTRRRIKPGTVGRTTVTGEASYRDSSHQVLLWGTDKGRRIPNHDARHCADSPAGVDLANAMIIRFCNVEVAGSVYCHAPSKLTQIQRQRRVT